MSAVKESATTGISASLTFFDDTTKPKPLECSVKGLKYSLSSVGETEIYVLLVDGSNTGNNK